MQFFSECDMTLKTEQELRKFKKNTLRGIQFRMKGGGITVKWTKLHDEELCSF
jgi:hypothetical protein